jgi:hypothetical protein
MQPPTTRKRSQYEVTAMILIKHIGDDKVLLQIHTENLIKIVPNILLEKTGTVEERLLQLPAISTIHYVKQEMYIINLYF